MNSFKQTMETKQNWWAWEYRKIKENGINFMCINFIHLVSGNVSSTTPHYPYPNLSFCWSILFCVAFLDFRKKPSKTQEAKRLQTILESVSRLEDPLNSVIGFIEEVLAFLQLFLSSLFWFPGNSVVLCHHFCRLLVLFVKENVFLQTNGICKGRDLNQ